MMIRVIIYGGVLSTTMGTSPFLVIIPITCGDMVVHWEKSSYKGGMNDGHPKANLNATHEKGWEEMAKNILRAEMMRRGVSYAGLAERLEAYGVNDNELNLRNKVSRGRFTAVFLMQCLSALGVEWIQVPGYEEASRKGGAQGLARKARSAPESA